MSTGPTHKLSTCSDHVQKTPGLSGVACCAWQKLQVCKNLQEEADLKLLLARVVPLDLRLAISACLDQLSLKLSQLLLQGLHENQ